MQRRSVLIEICPSEVRAAVVARGRIVASRSASQWVPDWKESWPGVLTGLAPRLRALVAELGAPGLPATIFYSAPRAAAGVFSCPATAGSSGAEAAAMLALADATEFAPDANPTMVTRLAADRTSRAPGAVGPQIHTLAATDPEASVRAVTQLGAECGLNVVGVVPTEAVALAAALGFALEASRAPGTAVVLRIGSWGCTLAAAVDGRIKFVRQISVGTASLVAALAGEVRSADGASSLVRLDRERAAALLSRAGVPARGTMFDVDSGLAAEVVLPRMQPVLQRCIVEVKQSLRFGLSEAERTGARLVACGPGSLLPNLSGILAAQIGLPLAEPVGAAGSPLCGGTIEDSCAGVLRGVEPLLPGERTEGRRLGTIRRGMWIGVAAACALGAVDGVSAWFELAGVRAQQATLAATLADSSQVAGIGRSLGERESALNASRQRLVAWMTPRVRWDAMLAVLARQTPPGIRLSGVQMRFDGRRPECAIRGHAIESAGADATTALKSYLESLSACPIVQKCSLGSARRSQQGEAGVQEFEVVISLVGLPADLGFALAPSENGR